MDKSIITVIHVFDTRSGRAFIDYLIKVQHNINRYKQRLITLKIKKIRMYSGGKIWAYLTDYLKKKNR